VWGHFAAKDYTAGCDRMTAMGQKLAAIANEDDSPEVRRSIEWLGQMVGALTKVADTGKPRESVAKVDARLMDLFTGDELALYEAGKREAGAVATDVTRDAEELQKKIDAKNEDERKKKLEEVATNLETSKERRESLKRSSEDWKAWLDERLDAADKQLARLEKDYDALEKRAQSLIQSQLQIQAQITLLSVPGPGTGTTPDGKATVQSQLQQQQISTLQRQQVAYQLEYERTALSALGVSQQAGRVVQDRMGAVKQYEKATGNLVKQEAALGKWEDRMKKDGEKLKKVAKDKASGSANKSAAPKTLRSYVDLNWAIERDRLLESVGIAPEQSPEK
jgi:DNA repair exonuclease SbcCD ATPase subunit